MKFYLLSILTNCYGCEFNDHVTVEANSDDELEEKTQDKIKFWFGEDPDTVDYIDDEGVTHFENGNSAYCERTTEISEDEFKVFQKYGF